MSVSPTIEPSVIDAFVDFIFDNEDKAIDRHKKELKRLQTNREVMQARFESLESLIGRIESKSNQARTNYKMIKAEIDSQEKDLTLGIRNDVDPKLLKKMNKAQNEWEEYEKSYNEHMDAWKNLHERMVSCQREINKFREIEHILCK